MGWIQGGRDQDKVLGPPDLTISYLVGSFTETEIQEMCHMLQGGGNEFNTGYSECKMSV